MTCLKQIASKGQYYLEEAILELLREPTANGKYLLPSEIGKLAGIYRGVGKNNDVVNDGIVNGILGKLSADDKVERQEKEEPDRRGRGWKLADKELKKRQKFLKSRKKFVNNLFLSDEFIENIINLLDYKQQVIFQGPPGTGKTYIAQKLARHLTNENDECWDLVQFHPSYSYEDFVRGYRPILENGRPTFRLKDGPLLRIAARARAVGTEQKCVLIIDEINRGNLAKVLGELYFLLEYRNQPIELMYREEGDEPFRMPPNLYIIGTMNTADRSIALVDLALRRRFAFVEFDPYEPPIGDVLDRWMKTWESASVAWLVELVRHTNEKLQGYNAAAVGSSYFMNGNGLDEEGVRRIWKHEVLPYIMEQFFGDDKKKKEFQLKSLKESMNQNSNNVAEDAATSPSQELQVNNAEDQSPGE